MTANAARGRPVSVTRVPDIFDANISIKDVANLPFTTQLQIQFRAAPGSFSLIVSRNTGHISSPLQLAVRSTGGTITVSNPAHNSFSPWVPR